MTLPGVKRAEANLRRSLPDGADPPRASDLVLYSGYDEIFASGLLAGADGGIGVQ